jgi:hypothetical protein
MLAKTIPAEHFRSRGGRPKAIPDVIYQPTEIRRDKFARNDRSGEPRPPRTSTEANVKCLRADRERPARVIFHFCGGIVGRAIHQPDGMPPQTTSRLIAVALVSCPRSSSRSAADVGDKQATENKELVARKGSSPDMADFRFGTLEQYHPDWDRGANQGDKIARESWPSTRSQRSVRREASAIRRVNRLLQAYRDVSPFSDGRY